MKKNYLIAIVLVLITMLSTTVFATSFSDLQKSHWAYEPIMEMANKGILNGYPDGTFLPDKSITRAEFAKILVVALNLKTNGKKLEFQDVSSDDWSYEYIQAAAKYLSAYRDDRNNLMYMPNAQAVREDVAVAIVVASGHENDKYSLKTLDKFSDKDQISTNLRKYVAIAVENGLMSGHTDGTFEPRGYLTRAQVSKLMKNIEDANEKVVIKDTTDSKKDNSSTTDSKTNSSSTATESYFDDIVFNTETLKLDLGENWDKYLYCRTDETQHPYVPAQRYLNYEGGTCGADKTTGYSMSSGYEFFCGKEKMTLKIMLKSNQKKYTTIQLRDPFYVSKSADKVYTNSNTNERYIEQIVETTNKLVKAEYCIDKGSWVDATSNINNKRLDIKVSVDKYDDEDEHSININLQDAYGNKWNKQYYFTIEKEYFTDISFDSKTLKLDLGEDWDKYLYCKIGEKHPYVPAQRYLNYEGSTCGKDKATGYSISGGYDFFTKEKMTLKIMLKDNQKIYTTIQLRDPFYISRLVDEATYINSNDDKRYIEVVVNATNKLTYAEYKIDNGIWIADATAINGKIADFKIDVEKYDNGKGHTFSVRLTDEYGNVGQKTDSFSFAKAYFSDISYNNKTLQLDLGENWDKYRLTKATVQNGVIYVPSQRKLTYKYNTASGFDETNRYLKTNSYERLLDTINRETVIKIMLKDDTSQYTTIKISDPFFVIDKAETVYTEASTGYKYIRSSVKTINEVAKVEYKIDSSGWITDNTAIGSYAVNLVVYVDEYNDGAWHHLVTRITDIYGNVWERDNSGFKM